MSIWIDGLGEVLALGPDRRLPVASNQKLLTAMGVLDTFELDATLRTTVSAVGTPDPVSGILQGDLVLVAGGDPTLTATGPHSLVALAGAVRAAGVRRVTGGLAVDESRFDTARSAPGWEDWQIPRYVGPQSAFLVDANRGRRDAAYLSDPALGNGEAFRRDLAAAGVAIDGPVSNGVAPPGARPITALASPPIGHLLSRMLMLSDNQVAESLTREAGVELTGEGSTPAGTAALEARLVDGCAPIAPGGWADGSGLSRDDLRSARELRRIVQHARTEPWWADLRARLPVAGRSAPSPLASAAPRPKAGSPRRPARSSAGRR